MVLMANDQAGQLLSPAAKGRHQIQIIGAANCGRIGKEDDGQSGHWERKKGRRGGCTKFWSNAAASLGDHSGEGSFPPPSLRYIATININCAVPVNLITFLINLTFKFGINFSLHIILENSDAQGKPYEEKKKVKRFLLDINLINRVNVWLFPFKMSLYRCIFNVNSFLLSKLKFC